MPTRGEMPIPIESLELCWVSELGKRYFQPFRAKPKHAVILTLLFFFCIPGSVDKGVVEVTNCFCVPHKEHDDQVEAELSYALDLYDLNRKVNPNENVVGK